jgi:hypothetical protein
LQGDVASSTAGISTDLKPNLTQASWLCAQRKVVDDADSSDYQVTDGEAEEPDEGDDLSDEDAGAVKSSKRPQRTRKPSARKVRRKQMLGSLRIRRHCCTPQNWSMAVLAAALLCYPIQHRLAQCAASFNLLQLQRKATKEAAASDYEVTDEKAELVEADEDDEDLLGEGGTFRLGQQDEEFHDFSSLKLKDDAHNRQAAFSTLNMLTSFTESTNGVQVDG